MQNIYIETSVVSYFVAGRSENIRIAGTLEGNLITQGKLVSGKSGIIRGNIKCKNSTIKGRHKGYILINL